MNRQPDKGSSPPGEGDADRLLGRLEAQLDEIEMHEIVDGLTDEDLREKGFVGEKPISLGPLVSRRRTEREHLMFADEVEFERIDGTATLAELDVRTYDHLRDVEPGELIAVRDTDEQAKFGAGANVKLEVKGKEEHYSATARGKVLIHGDELAVLPSDLDCRVDIRISEDRMCASMDCVPAHGGGRPLTPAAVDERLKAGRVVYGIDRAAIQQVVEQANARGAAVAGVTVARGTPAIPGDAGRVDYQFDPDAKDYNFTILSDGRIDYKNTRHIIMANAGDLLARIEGPRKGVPGIDVHNGTVPAPESPPVFLVAGRGAKASADGREVIATHCGSVVLNGSLIEVVDTHIVDGDVDYSSGNIRFNGNVVINGTVREGFMVEAGGDVIVAKCVEAARVEAGRDVIIRGGVQGKGKGLVSAGRDIRVGYAQNARVEAQGNIHVASYVINSYVSTSRSLYVLDGKGVLVGGETYALRGIDVKVLGSENGTRTVVETGTDFLVLRKIAELDEVVRFCAESIAKIDESLRGVRELVKWSGSLPREKGALVKKVLDKRQHLEERRAAVTVKMKDIEKHLHEKDACLVRVKQSCFPDVIVRIRGLQMHVSQLRENVRFYDDRAEATIKTAPY